MSLKDYARGYAHGISVALDLTKDMRDLTLRVTLATKLADAQNVMSKEHLAAKEQQVLNAYMEDWAERNQSAYDRTLHNLYSRDLDES